MDQKEVSLFDNPKDEIIKVRKSEGGKDVVNARELWNCLGSTIEYSKWIKRRITENEFAIEGEDWAEVIDNQVLATNGENPKGGRPSKEYALTLTFAKKIAMMEKSANGETVRQYFIACEKRLRELDIPSYQIENRIKRAEKWIEEEKERQRLYLENQEQKKKIEEDKPKVEFAEDILCSVGTLLVGEFAKVLTKNGYPIGQNRLFKWFRDNGYMGKNGEFHNTPLQKYVEQGLFQIKQTTWENNGIKHLATTTVITVKGQEYFLKKFKQNYEQDL